jgi:hypothetical protein
MPNYRLYFLNQKTGHIDKFEALQAPDDAAALARAKTFEGEYALELWCGPRKVTHMEANDPQSRLMRRWREHRAGKVPEMD